MKIFCYSVNVKSNYFIVLVGPIAIDKSNDRDHRYKQVVRKWLVWFCNVDFFKRYTKKCNLNIFFRNLLRKFYCNNAAFWYCLLFILIYRQCIINLWILWICHNLIQKYNVLIYKKNYKDPYYSLFISWHHSMIVF